ncbi:MAG: anaerobic ribonucleoside-triphosphate reductase activating protein [Coriobacteriia bacterium]|nr:anaerobic ribonucleoside-triphosphate reductase activating protein [Coriobacteriia bacterium]
MSSPTSGRVGGFVPLSTVDWPGQLAATVFLRGCPWACSYCHNAHLQSTVGAGDDVVWSEFVAFLETRAGLLDAVVFSGGEPTMTHALPGWMTQVKTMGFAVGLHSGGADPERFAAALTRADWVGFDVKAPFDEYALVTGVADSGTGALASLRRLVASGTTFEARTTVATQLLAEGVLERMAAELEREGVRRWVLQTCRTPEGGGSPAALTTVLDSVSLAATFGSRFDLVVR